MEFLRLLLALPAALPEPDPASPLAPAWLSLAGAAAMAMRGAPMGGLGALLGLLESRAAPAALAVAARALVPAAALVLLLLLEAWLAPPKDRKRLRGLSQDVAVVEGAAAGRSSAPLPIRPMFSAPASPGACMAEPSAAMAEAAAARAATGAPAALLVRELPARLMRRASFSGSAW